MTAVTLRRYTNLAAIIDMLRSKAITLLDPAFWEDKNDTYFLSRFKEQKRAQSLLVLCFAETWETHHHWRVFSYGSDGICVEFDKDALLHSLEKYKGLKWGSVVYKEIKAVRKRHPFVDELPFLKRYPFEAEREFRLVYVAQDEATDSKRFQIPLKCIRRVTLSPWMPLPFSKAVKETLRDISGCKRLKIYRSTLIENEKWKSVAKEKIQTD